MGGPDGFETQVLWTCRQERGEENVAVFQGIPRPRHAEDKSKVTR